MLNRLWHNRHPYIVSLVICGGYPVSNTFAYNCLDDNLCMIHPLGEKVGHLLVQSDSRETIYCGIRGYSMQVGPEHLRHIAGGQTKYQYVPVPCVYVCTYVFWCCCENRSWWPCQWRRGTSAATSRPSAAAPCPAPSPRRSSTTPAPLPSAR